MRSPRSGCCRAAGGSIGYWLSGCGATPLNKKPKHRWGITQQPGDSQSGRQTECLARRGVECQTFICRHPPRSPLRRATRNLQLPQ
ncbi:uncharacterized protein Dana_GF27987 [Drosophila ananassae]|uniref:Uncharacterized protein n=1 Tax=Drosophila ananassae TaxID=7217 RepID=A0A0P9AX35_DROAN|nr:uncharacterized protein Dana_GF27987 [Drosophila ananassae]